MSEYYKNKEYKKKTEYSSSKDFKRGGFSSHRDRDPLNKKHPPEKKLQQPTILIKARDTDRAPSPNTSTASTSKKDVESAPSYQIQTKAPSVEVPAPTSMSMALPLFNPGLTILQDGCLDYLSEEGDYLVVGCLGGPGVGKSTIMSLLAKPNTDSTFSDAIFWTQGFEDVAAVRHKTWGINFYVTTNRIILLDCQPILSASMTTGGDSNAEMQSLELAAFLFSSCHIVLFVQDYFLDPDLVRFLQTAEMLKPSQSIFFEEAMVEHFPHLVFVHNKAESWEFRAERVKEMQDTYLKAFSHSRLQIQTGFGIANGEVSPTLNTASSGELINLFLLPNFDTDDSVYTGHPSFKDIFRHLHNQILSTPRTALSNSSLTEKLWFHWAVKVWDNIQKSNFFNEYHRLINAL